MHLSSGTTAHSAIMRLMKLWRFGCRVGARAQGFDGKCTMSSAIVKLGILAAGLMLSGCMQATTFEATSQTNFKQRDKELLAKVSYVKTPVPEAFRRAIVDYHRKEAPGSIVVDSDNHYLYLVQDGGKAIRYGLKAAEACLAV